MILYLHLLLIVCHFKKNNKIFNPSDEHFFKNVKFFDFLFINTIITILIYENVKKLIYYENIMFYVNMLYKHM